MKNCLKLDAKRALACAAFAIAALVVSKQAIAQTNRPNPLSPGSAPTVSAPQVAEGADRLLRQMSTYIGSAERFTVHADVTFDHVLPTGQKLQFSATEDIALQRPNGLYVQWNSDLGNREFWYDGKAVTIYDPDKALYGTESAPPAIDGMLEKLNDQLNFTPPLVDFLFSDPYKGLRGTIQYGFETGDAQFGGRTCRGLAFVGKHIDWQIWIDTGPQLVPCKLLITYKNNQASPQFSAVFANWDFTPRIAAATFVPDLPRGSQGVAFKTVRVNVGSK